MIFIPRNSKNYAMVYDELWTSLYALPDVERLGLGGNQSAQPLMADGGLATPESPPKDR